MENITEEIQHNLKTLGFLEIERLPKLQEVKKAYFAMSKELHPDKHMAKNDTIKKDFEEKFKLLLSAYKNVSTFIIENGESIEEDEEEKLVKKEFENVNVVTVNQNSITLSIPKQHTESWVEALHKKYGRPLVMEYSSKLRVVSVSNCGRSKSPQKIQF